MTEEKKSMVPKLRFPEFTETWEQRKFYDCFKLLRNNSLARAELAKIGKIRNIHYGDVLINYPEVLNISTATVPFIAESRVNSISKDSYLENGDIVIADTAEDESVGKTTEIQGITDHKIVSGLHTIPCRPLVNFSPNFLGFLLNSPSYHDQLKPLIQGIKVSSISKKALGETRVCFAKDLDEQAQIGGFFNGLEMLITLHQRKLDVLNKLKKYLLQKMFPENGQLIPELRFPAFSGAWEQRKLSEIVRMNARIGWQNLRQSEFLDDGDFLLITGTDFKNGRVNFGTCHYIAKERFDQDPKIQVEEGSILLTKDGTIGKVALVDKLSKPATLNAGVYNIVPKNRVVESRFLFQYLSAPFLLDYVNKAATGGTIKHLNQSILVDFPVSFPSVAEQEKIGKFLEGIDHVTTLHQRKLEGLRKLKKSLLQQMFV